MPPQSPFALADERRPGRPGSRSRTHRCPTRSSRTSRCSKAFPWTISWTPWASCRRPWASIASECHVGAGTDTVKWEADTAKKRTARRMTLMVAAINTQQLRRTAGRDLLDLSSRPRHSRHACRRSIRCTASRSWSPMTSSRSRFPGEPTADQILDKYLQALGGAERLASVTSFIATGTSEGFRGFGGGGQVQIFAKAPGSARDDHQVCRKHRTAGCHTALRRPQRMGVGAAVRRAGIRPGWKRTGWRHGSTHSCRFRRRYKKALSQLRVGPPD